MDCDRPRQAVRNLRGVGERVGLETLMTDEEKIKIMFEIRKKERPDLKDSFSRVEGCMLSPSYNAYHALLVLYNERFGDNEGIE